MIRVFIDQDGDPVAIDTAQIVGVSVGRLSGPRVTDPETVVTLIWAHGVAQPFMVAVDFDAVMAEWQAGRRRDDAASSGWKFLPVAQGSR